MSKTRTTLDREILFRECMYKNVDLKMGSDHVVNTLRDMGFFTAPASTKYHGSYEGGLFDHSYNVAFALEKLTKNNYLNWSRKASPYIIGMFHDLCKCDQYERVEFPQFLDPDECEWKKHDDTLLKGHGDKSIILLSQFTTLTEEEILCIRYHMGAFTEKEEWQNYTRAVHKHPNVLWTHTADMIAAHIMEKDGN